MIEPRQDIVELRECRARGHGGALDHQHAQPQFARGDELGLGPRAAGVLGDDQLGPVVAQQGDVSGHVERPAGEGNGRVRQGQRRVGLVHQPQQIVVLGMVGKDGQRLLADGQKDPRRGLRQGCGGGFDIRQMGPGVGGGLGPRGTFIRGQRDTGLRTGGMGVTTHLCGERMGRVDHAGDVVLRDKVQQSGHATETTHAGGQRLRHGGRRASGIAEQRIIATFSQRAGEAGGLCRAAKNEGARHG